MALGDYALLFTNTVSGSSTASVTYSSIPQTYKHLEVRYSTADSRSAGDNYGYVSMTINSAPQYYRGWNNEMKNGSGATALTQNGAAPDLYGASGTDINPNGFNTAVNWIWNYTSGNNKATLLWGSNAAASSSQYAMVGIWRYGGWLSNAVTTITWSTDAGKFFKAGSLIQVYGIK